MKLEEIKNKLILAPKNPGCYLMKNIQEEIIYVGKAKNLQNRLRSYFTGSHNAKTTKMLSNVFDFEYIITSTEIEALILELNLIKLHRPKFNIMLMDDKTYPYLHITNETHPRLLYTRDISHKKGKYFGPYPNSGAAKETQNLLNKVYPLRKCVQLPKKECLYYYLGQCLAPCINEVKQETYDDIIKDIQKFLNGNQKDLITSLNTKMTQASENLEFEKAIEYREMINNLNATLEKQKMSSNDLIDRDIFGYAVRDDILSIQVFHMRLGKMVMRNGEIFELVNDAAEAFYDYIAQFYKLKNNPIPPEILSPPLGNKELLEELLGTKIVVPVKGDKKKLIELVCENAYNKIDELIKIKEMELSKTIAPVQQLRKILDIDYPHVIEVFDNSNLQGTSAVSAMAVFIDGKPSKKNYRKFKLCSVKGPDDYQSMTEVISRRYSKLVRDGKGFPNLIIVDGGKGQVSSAKEALKTVHAEFIPMIGLVKDDRHKTRGIINGKNFEEIKIDKTSQLFILLERMQEEVHRFAIAFHRDVHSKGALSSALDYIEGIGSARKKVLLENFSSTDEIKQTTIEKLMAIGFPKKVATSVLEALNKDNFYTEVVR